MRLLYQNRLTNKLKPTTENIEEDWINIKQAILEAAFQSLGYKQKKMVTNMECRFKRNH
jgi:hypothetical protein